MDEILYTFLKCRPGDRKYRNSRLAFGVDFDPQQLRLISLSFTVRWNYMMGFSVLQILKIDLGYYRT